MKGDSDDYFTRDQLRKYNRGNISQEKVNSLLDCSLLEELLQKEEEIVTYKNHLKELEAAFYYNLELISERDLELSIFEKKLALENEQLQEVIRERDELDDLIKIMDEKNNRKIQQLEMRLLLKEEEIKDLQRENTTSVNTLKRLIGDMKQQQENKLCKISTKFEIQKNELIKSYRDEVEEKEKYYLLEIDHLTGKLEQANREKEKLAKTEDENKNLKCDLEDLKRHFVEKENRYLEELRKINYSSKRKINKEVQCIFKPQEVEKKIQAQPDLTTAVAQTSQYISDSEESNIQKINFLLEQNEVLKYIIKDLKKNQIIEPKSHDPRKPPGCECLAIKTEVEKVNKKFENEINNLKKILEEEQKQRTEEDSVLQSLEARVNCLKDKLLLGLQEKFNDFAGEDICTYTHNREIHNEIQVTLLEQKLNKKIDFLMAAAEDEIQKIREKLEEIRKECIEKMENLKPREEPTEFNSENLLEQIRLEIHKLENKIETDMKNMVRNNYEKNKCDKNFQGRLELSEAKQVLNSMAFYPDYSEAVPVRLRDTLYPENEFREPLNPCRFYYGKELPPEKYISISKCDLAANSQIRIKKKFGGQKGFRTVTNNIMVER